MKKRLLTMTLALALAIALCACDGGPRGGGKVQFDGALSPQSYSDATDAINAFLTDEIAGESSEIEYVSYQKRADLTADEIVALDLELAEVSRAEKGVVTYTDTPEVGESVSKNHELYLIAERKGTFRYFAPASQIGEMITRSEYESIFCRDNFTFEVSGTSSGQKIKQIEYVAEDEIWYEATVYVPDAEEMILQEYIDFAGDKPTLYVLFSGMMGGVWMDAGKYFDADAFQQYLEMAQQSRATYPFELLERTSYGYTISADKMYSYVDNVTQNLLGSLGEYAKFESKDAYGSMELYIKDGLLSEAKGRYGVTKSLTMSYGGETDTITQKIDCVMQGRFYDYGVTKVEIPDDLKEFIVQNK